MSPDSLHPTLWRTCRVLANQTRLRLFTELLRLPRQSVSELADSLALTLPVASQSLRALEARGLIRVNRIGRRVEYRIPSGAEAGVLQELIGALRKTLRGGSQARTDAFKLATAFTHPARISIYRQLHFEPLTPAQLKARLRLSWPALLRHLTKLERRGYVVCQESTSHYAVTSHRHELGRALAKLAVA